MCEAILNPGGCCAECISESFFDGALSEETGAKIKLPRSPICLCLHSWSRSLRIYEASNGEKFDNILHLLNFQNSTNSLYRTGGCQGARIFTMRSKSSSSAPSLTMALQTAERDP